MKYPTACGDWDFYFVLGDLNYGNVSNDEKQILIENIAFSLKPNTHVIQRIERISRSWQRTPIEEIFQLWKKGEQNKYRAFDLQCLTILGHHDKKNMKYGVKQGFELLKQYWDGKKFVHPDKDVEKFLYFFQIMWEPFEKEWAFLYDEDMQLLLSKYFNILKIEHCNDYYMAKEYPVWIMQKSNY